MAKKLITKPTLYLNLKTDLRPFQIDLIKQIKDQYDLINNSNEAVYRCIQLQNQITLVTGQKKDKVQIKADFLSNKLAYRQGKPELICKATGITKKPLRIIDATAGLGKDSFILAAYGAQVTMIEKNPLLALLLENALFNAEQVINLKSTIGRLKLECADSALNMPVSEVIYLDPMYPHRQKSAWSKKEMRLFQQLLINQPTNEMDLLNKAREQSTVRVVVKRPLKGAYLANIKPAFNYCGKNVRFDIYLP